MESESSQQYQQEVKKHPERLYRCLYQPTIQISIDTKQRMNYSSF